MIFDRCNNLLRDVALAHRAVEWAATYAPPEKEDEPMADKPVDTELRLQCVELANGDVVQARAIHAFVTGSDDSAVRVREAMDRLREAVDAS